MNMQKTRGRSRFAAVLGILCLASAAVAQGLPANGLADRGDLAMISAAPAPDAPRNLDTHHLFTTPASKQAWETRKKALREQILFSAGLWPMPKKTPLNPRITGRIDGPD